MPEINTSNDWSGNKKASFVTNGDSNHSDSEPAYVKVTIAEESKPEEEVYTVDGYAKENTDTVPKVLSNVPVILKKGSAIIKETKTDAEGKYTFTNVTKGTYNIVVEKYDTDGNLEKTMTKLIEVTSNVQVDDIILPKSAVSSVVEVKDDTPAIIIGSLDLEAESQAEDGSRVTVKLTASSQKETAVTDEQTQTAIAAIKDIKSADSDTSGMNLDYFNFDVIKTTSGSTTKVDAALHETKNVIEIVIPYNTKADKEGYTRVFSLFRYHVPEGSTEGVTQKLESLAARPTEQVDFKDGTYFVGDGFIYLYSNKFSTYALGFEDRENTSSGSGSGGGSSSGPASVNYSRESKEATVKNDVYYVTNAAGQLVIAKKSIVKVTENGTTKYILTDANGKAFTEKGFADAVNIKSIKASQIKSTEVTVYIKEDGTLMHAKRFKVGSKKAKYYAADANGVIIQDGFFNKKYPDVTSRVAKKGATFYADQDGVILQYGIYKINGKRYALNKIGKIKKNGIIKIKKKKYIAKKNGSLYTEKWVWLDSRNKNYYCSKTGKVTKEKKTK